MYRVSACPIPDSMLADLTAAANYQTGRIGIAIAWAFKSMAVVGLTVTALYALGQGWDYLFPNAGDLRGCTLRTPLNIFEIVPWILGTVGLGAVGFSQLHWRHMREQARLAWLDLDSGECERIDAEIPEQHIIVDDEDFTLLLLPDGTSRTIVLNIFHNGNDLRVEMLFDKETCRAIWSWKRSRHVPGAWDVETSGAPLQLRDPVPYGSTTLDEVLLDPPDDGAVLDVPFERMLELSREKRRKRAKRATRAAAISADGAAANAAPVRVV